ncbi:hypothetical protein OCK74_27305 [Chitinophagaceae bacterium LB-8]|uniref:Uncharacterized protein n=1 Tax=Paraflavisolibacter caeni TaxID=2982496 RepID=A0A9X2Y1I2_9BACT|nr:hypothetical protein [Paraflavisolibacter caeni]MCU7552857.1 hypothetical protein [Paraflavisolibacter caeni]
MKNSLEKLYYLINVRINTVNTVGIDASCRFLEIWINETTSETDSIRTYLLKKSVDIENEQSLVLLIYQCQSALIRLLDKVFSYMDPASPLNGTYDTILKRLEKLLHFIECHYPKYFNKEEKVPDHLLHATQTLIKKELRHLEKTVFAGTDPRLKKILCSHLQRFTQNNNEEFICYKKLAYVKELVAELKDMSLACQQLMDLLIYMNFNTSDFFQYYVANLGVEIAACNLPAQKRDVLLSAFKSLNQLQEKPGIAFKPKMKNLKEQIRAWISEEINYLDQQQAYFTVFNEHSPPAPEIIDEEKLHTSLSVQQLAVFIRAARDAGVLTNKNQTALLKAVASIFHTPNANSISAESLRSKYYTPEPSALDSVKDILMKMFNKVQSY